MSSIMGTASDNVHLERYEVEQEEAMGKVAFRTATTQLIRNVLASQKDKNRTMIHCFTFLRDPIRRFLSSVGQTMLAKRLRLKRNSPMLLPCLDVASNTTTTAATARNPNHTDTQALLHCVLDTLEQQNPSNRTISYLDIHLVPQSYDLFVSSLQQDIAVHVMDLSWLNFVAHGILQTNATIAKEMSASGTNHGFHLVMDQVTDDLVRRVCRFYEVDVLMLKATAVVSDSPCFDLLL